VIEPEDEVVLTVLGIGFVKIIIYSIIIQILLKNGILRKTKN